jgi:hypothetical protein
LLSKTAQICSPLLYVHEEKKKEKKKRGIMKIFFHIKTSFLMKWRRNIKP